MVFEPSTQQIMYFSVSTEFIEKNHDEINLVGCIFIDLFWMMLILTPSDYVKYLGLSLAQEISRIWLANLQCISSIFWVQNMRNGFKMVDAGIKMMKQ